MSDPCAWPALAGAAALMGEVLHCELGVWGKVHGQASDYRWIARTPGFGGPPDLDRSLRIGAEDQTLLASAWRAPWWAGAAAHFAVGLYPSRARDAAGRAAVLEKRVLKWQRPAAVPVALGALALLPAAAAGDDRCWWDRVGEGDWRQGDYALPLGPSACPAVVLDSDWLAAAVAQGLAELRAAVGQSRLAALYAALLSGRRPVLLDGPGGPLSPLALAALLLPLSPAEAERCSFCAGVPAVLIDADDLGRNWDLAVTCRPGPGPQRVCDSVPAPTPDSMQRAVRLAAALAAGDPGLLRGCAGPADPGNAAGRRPVGPQSLPDVHSNPESNPWPNPRLGLAVPDRDGLDGLYRFADTVNLRRLDLRALGRDLADPRTRPGLAPGDDPAAHPLIGWIRALEASPPAGVDVAEWGLKVDQLRAAALVLLPHPRTLDLVGLPGDPRVPALLAVLALPPGCGGGALAGHGETALRRMRRHTQGCPDAALVLEILSRLGA